MKRGLKSMRGLASLAILATGCGGSEQSPEPKKPGASREFVEHPLDAVGGDKKAKQPVAPKVQADLEKAKKADPRQR